ncbi:MAG: Uma2 family endonuclease [Planctomycetes bacterium]|nr:Uma2 family endonuclease [Planctomycetota bacterium]
MSAVETVAVADLHSGDRMSQEEFHRIYEQMPEDFRAELIGGIVYVSSPLKRPHGTNQLPLGSLFFHYESLTSGVECADNTTVILADDAEPQPDLFLRILEECGGRSRVTPDDYIAGPPELLAEIAHSSRAVDLHAKRDDYARHGVLEYLVLCVRERRLRWFDLANDAELEPGDDGIYRIRTFPGLWIDGAALVDRDSRRLMDVLNRGLATPEHAAFVERLAAARGAHKDE